MSGACYVTIFLPREILHNLSCTHLFGYYDNTLSKYIINCTLSMELCKNHNSIQNFRKVSHEQNELNNTPYKFQYLGIIYSSKRKKKFIAYNQENEDNIWFVLHVDLITNMFHIEKLLFNAVPQEYSVNILLYDNKFLVSCNMLATSMYSVGSKNFLTYLINTLKCSEKSFITKSVNSCDRITDFSYSSNKNCCFKIFSYLFQFLEIFLQWCIFFSSFRFCNSILKVLNKTHVGQQFYQRFLHVRDICLNWRTKERIEIKSKNLICAVIFDIICGWAITIFILKSDPLDFLLDITINQVNIIVNGLQKIIYWLMGVPVGLKLNIPLNSALGHFFLYHIYLWEAYITIILPVFTFLLKISTVIGIAGLTFSLCLLSDIVSLATVHIYCFYGYATRLYGYQISCLLSLWRLFRGKKWNPLRQRVDSYSYDVHQLYLGTLFFTVLLFLLPTVLVYYFVFTCLRIVVLIIQGILIKITDIISILPLYSVISRILYSSETVGDVYFSVFSSKAVLVLSMEAVQSSFSRVIKCTLPELYKFDGGISWKSLLSNIIWGEIIYPL